MSTDFFAGYASGVVGICVGNPLDVVKVQLQSGNRTLTPTSDVVQTRHPAQLFKGVAAPIMAYGALNSLLYVTYNRSLKVLDPSIADPTRLHHVKLSKIWLAGAVGGLASWVVSAPSELIKCRTQLHNGPHASSLNTFKQVWKFHGVQGLYLGGFVTSLRDVIGYGFYFSSYEICRRLFSARSLAFESKAADFDVLLSGGIAGVSTWASVYPLDVVKTRMQAEGPRFDSGRQSQLYERGMLSTTKHVFSKHGFSGFFRGLTICSVRAFFVNAIQWYTYEKMMALFSTW